MTLLYKPHHDDEYIDEIRVAAGWVIVHMTTVPRYKTSDASGDEWRTSAEIAIIVGERRSRERSIRDLDLATRLAPRLITQIRPEDACGGEASSLRMLRKGHLVYQLTGMPLDTLLAMLPLEWVLVWESDRFQRIPDAENYTLCFQAGCAEPATSVLRLRREYNRSGRVIVEDTDRHRAFCDRHVERGDCDLEDADRNYVLVSGPGVAGSKRRKTDESESAMVFV